MERLELGGHGVRLPHLHSGYTGGSQKEMHWEIQWKIIASVHNAKFWCVVCFVRMSMVHKWGCGCVHTCAHLRRPEQNLRCLPLLLRSLAELEPLARLAALGTHRGLSGLQCWNYSHARPEMFILKYWWFWGYGLSLKSKDREMSSNVNYNSC